ncbi:MAG: hypothetical protein IJ558_13590 [Treponema sp.]|nr:hypothetical protein [Treponema sp.]
MKSKIFGVSLGSSIFILLLIAVLALVRPVYLRIDEALSEFESTLSERLENETGLAVSYQSLSPSIFIGVNFKNIGVYDVATKSRILTIKRAGISYNVSGFFSKTPTVALKELSLNGVTVEYDAVKDSQFIDKIKTLLENQKKNAETDLLTAEKGTKIQFVDREFDIPLDISIKNIALHYSDENQDVVATLKSLKLKDFSFSDGANINTSGKLLYKTNRIQTLGHDTSVACGFSLKGTFYPDLEGSSAFVSLSGSSGADYSVSNLSVLVNYTDEKLEVRSMRTVLPFSLFATFDVATGSVVFSGDFDKFNPFKLVSIRRKNEMMQKIDGSLVTGSVSGRLTRDMIMYRSNLSVDVSKKLFGEPASLVLKFDGGEDRVNISRVSVDSSFVSAAFAGEFDIARLQPSGTFTLDYFVLSNGSIVSTEVFVDPYQNGFMCFAPQIFLGEKSFNALQLTVFPGSSSVDFQFELLDYAHPDFDETGRLQIEGSFLTGDEKFVQTSISFSNIFADSLVDTVAFFLPADQRGLMESIASSVRPFIFTTDAYVSSDFKDFSVNAPYCLFANTEKDRQLLIFAVDGSKETLQLSQFDLQFGKQSAHAEISVEFADMFREFSFNGDFAVNSIPYRFFGNFTPQWISISGDYNFDAIVSIDEQIGATLQFDGLPFSVGKNVFAASTNSIIYWSKTEGFEANIISLEIEEPSLNLQFNPHFALSGTANKHGFVLDTLAYTDNTSSLEGNGSIVWNLNGSIFDSIHLLLQAESPITSERLSLSADFTNPSQLPFSADALKNDFYMAVELSVDSFPASRFLSLQNPDNTISADLTATGTVDNPFVSVQLHRSSLLLSGYPLVASGGIVLDDTGVNLDNLNFSWGALEIKDVNAFFDPLAFSGKADVTIDVSILEKSIHAPFTISLEGEPTGKRFSVPDFYSVTVSSPLITGTFFNSDFPLFLSALHTPGRFDIMTDKSDGFTASYTTDGEIYAATGKKSPIRMNVAGSIQQNRLNIDITGIVADMKFICSEVEIPFVYFNYGVLTGALRISGLMTDPEYTGALSVSHPNFLISYISQNYLHADKVIMTVADGEARVEPTTVSVGKGFATVEYRMEFNKWLPSALELKIDIDDNRKVPLDLSFPFIHAKGLASGNLDLNFTFPRDVSVSGFVIADNTDVEIVATSLQNQFSLDNILASVPDLKKNKNKQEEEESSELNVTVDFDIIVGQKVQMLFNPFMRGVVAPGTPISLFFDSYTGDFEFKSDIVLRGGEIAWLNRNFYMKQGRIVFNESKDSLDPKVTVRAETRERDDNGNMVTIILSANNQSVSQFNPTFSANPAKSEKEIMELLGQVVSGDSDSVASLAVAGGDYFVQATVMRRIENTLREMMNFDIFSIRTNVLQNSLKLSMDEDSKNKQISIGNFVDNSTVYFGKYFGSSIYVDSLLQWTYDESKIEDRQSTTGIVFQPELGFEMASPFVNIRLGVAPDLSSLQKGLLNTFVPSTSMTLSWKFAF